MYASLLRRARARPGFGGAGRRAARPRRGGACSARPRMCSCSPSTVRCARTDTSGVGRPTYHGPGCCGCEPASGRGSRTLFASGIGGRQGSPAGDAAPSPLAAGPPTPRTARSIGHRSTPAAIGCFHREHPGDRVRWRAGESPPSTRSPRPRMSRGPIPLERATRPGQQLFDGAERHNREEAVN